MIANIYGKLPTGIKIFNFEIRFYAILIVCGAVIAYLLSRYFCRKGGFDVSIVEGTFYIGFPMGIVGARIWYVIAEWNKEFAGGPFWDIFKIWKGGLAVQGGVILGAIAGMLYIHHRKPNLNVFAIADLIVPNILIAQAIGRWGNFFNCEVYGVCVDASKWSMLPSFIKEQLTYNSQGGPACLPGQIVTPLFLIESTINLIGFFIIMFGIRKLLAKYIKPGDLVASYLIWYGIVRVVMEPMRNPMFQMGTAVLSSLVMAIAFIVGGVLLIFVFHWYDSYKKKKLAHVDDYRDAYFAYRKAFENRENKEVEVIETKEENVDKVEEKKIDENSSI